jgi:hypothetical protein
MAELPRKRLAQRRRPATGRIFAAGIAVAVVVAAFIYVLTAVQRMATTGPGSGPSTGESMPAPRTTPSR